LIVFSFRQEGVHVFDKGVRDGGGDCLGFNSPIGCLPLKTFA
jgi:hypothetical protein